MEFKLVVLNLSRPVRWDSLVAAGAPGPAPVQRQQERRMLNAVCLQLIPKQVKNTSLANSEEPFE